MPLLPGSRHIDEADTHRGADGGSAFVDRDLLRRRVREAAIRPEDRQLDRTAILAAPRRALDRYADVAAALIPRDGRAHVLDTPRFQRFRLNPAQIVEDPGRAQALRQRRRAEYRLIGILEADPIVLARPLDGERDQGQRQRRLRALQLADRPAGMEDLGEICLGTGMALFLRQSNQELQAVPDVRLRAPVLDVVLRQLELRVGDRTVSMLRAGTPDEMMESLRGPFPLAGKPLLADAGGPFGTPITDSVRVKIQPGTTEGWLVAYLPAGVVSGEAAGRALRELAAAADVEVAISA